MKRFFLHKRAIYIGIVVLLLPLTGLATATPAPQGDRSGAPSVISYQGQVLVGGTPYSGTGYFKFAVVDSGGTTSYWSNDGTSTSGNEPTAGVMLTVDVGLFNVLLGDVTLPGMTQPLAASVFIATDTWLRVWFSSDGITYQQLSPDQRIAAVAYAFNAEYFRGSDGSQYQLVVNGACDLGSAIWQIYPDGQVACDNFISRAGDADTLDGLQGNAYQLQIDGTCPVGSTIRSINPDGSVACEAHDTRLGFLISSPDTSGYIGLNTSITIGWDGLPVIAYSNFTEGDLKVVHCGDPACTTGNTFSILDMGIYVGSNTSIAIGSDGFPVISYYNYNNGDLKVAHCGDIACKTDNTLTIVDAVDDVGLDTSIAIGIDGLPVISYYDYTNGNLKVTHCGNVACSGGNIITTLDSAGNVGLYTSIAIGGDGLPVISYWDFSYQDLKVAHCEDIACSTSTLATLESVTDNGSYSSITIGGDGLPVISYYDSSSFLLKVAHCGDASCSTGNTLSILESGIETSIYTSITIGADGLPVIGYCGSNDDLKVAHCGDAACSTGNTLSTLDSGSDEVGRFTSITIGVDGLPVISYFDYTNWDLKVAHCSNVLCIPYWRRR